MKGLYLQLFQNLSPAATSAQPLPGSTNNKAGKLNPQGMLTASLIHCKLITPYGLKRVADGPAHGFC